MLYHKRPYWACGFWAAGFVDLWWKRASFLAENEIIDGVFKGPSTQLSCYC